MTASISRRTTNAASRIGVRLRDFPFAVAAPDGIRFSMRAAFPIDWIGRLTIPTDTVKVPAFSRRALSPTR
jgi:hypothetical protein